MWSLFLSVPATCWDLRFATSFGQQLKVNLLQEVANQTASPYVKLYSKKRSVWTWLQGKCILCGIYHIQHVRAEQYYASVEPWRNVCSLCPSWHIFMYASQCTWCIVRIALENMLTYLDAVKMDSIHNYFLVSPLFFLACCVDMQDFSLS